MDDESVERELFALRASALPVPRLDVGDVIARARRPQRDARRIAWVGALACAAASYLGFAHTGERDVILATPLRSPEVSVSAFDGLACREGVSDALVTSDEPAMSIAPIELVCE
jgi:hypothetical protein